LHPRWVKNDCRTIQYNFIIRDVPICFGQLPENAKIGAIGDGAIATTMGNNKDNGGTKGGLI
jgi:hypothetical protein